MTLLENMQRLLDAVNAIRNSIIGKGVTPSGGIDTYASAIDSMVVGGTDVSDTTAGAADVKEGKIFHTSDGEITEGTFAGETKTVSPATSAQDVTPSDGKYLSKVTVNAMPTVDIPNPTIRAVDEMIIANGSWDKGYTIDSSYSTSVSAPSLSSDLIPQNVLENKTIFGVRGTNRGWDAGVKYYQPKTVSFDPSSTGNVTVLSQSGTTYVLPGKMPRRAFGTVTTTANTAKTVTLGWKPKYVMVCRNRSNSNTMFNMYYNGTDLNASTGSSSASTTSNITPTDSGFTISAQGTYYGTCYYMAIE